MLLRHALIVLPLQVGLAVTWLSMLLPPARLPAAFRWFWAAVLIVLFGVAPLVLRYRYLIARHAIEAKGSPHDNLDVPESARPGEWYSTWPSSQAGTP
jgi:hypothetical protein